jgi:hypothetical protein
VASQQAFRLVAQQRGVVHDPGQPAGIHVEATMPRSPSIIGVIVASTS